jgi:tRNA uridine 5-carboxymethylaminomethyl modification enzyme
VEHFDVLILGGGHAGAEAAFIASQFKLNIGLVTLPGVPIASAPCNPSIGGVGKGQVVRELDALGGLMPILADLSGIQYRTLNESKGPAVHSTRVQIDKNLYPQSAENILSQINNLSIIRDTVCSISKNDHFELLTESGKKLTAVKLILTVGTFLNGKLHCGEVTSIGGRIDVKATKGISSLLCDIKLGSARFKTGTPARLLASSVDYSKFEEQPSDDATFNFHWAHLNSNRFVKQVSCYLTRTNPSTMQIIRENKELSPMYNGQIKAVGARYCPSIEDKAYRYPDKNDHHVFVEPEGLTANTLYPSGVSSSLPADVQAKFLKTISGFEEVEIVKAGYAVEYDVIDTTQLNLSLECKHIEGLYFAGQVNGTSGYEEAAGQGFIAGCNAALSFLNRAPLILNRSNSYIGVMIEDLVSNLRDEPYRLFTARSENRLSIREDNTYIRMSSYRLSLGLNQPIDLFLLNYINDFDFYLNFLDLQLINSNTEFLTFITNNDEKVSEININRYSELLSQSWLNPEIVLRRTMEYFGFSIDRFLLRNLAIEIKYGGYVKKADQYNQKMNKLDQMKINYQELTNSQNISFECKQRIERIKPTTFGQLKRIEGIRQATLAVVAGIAY